MAEFKEFRNLEDFAAFLGYDFPEEIHIVAACEGFYETDDQGDPFLSINGEEVENSRFVYAVYEGNPNTTRNDYNIYFS